VKRVERVRLYPTPRQERALRFMLDLTRDLYNAALQERRDAYRLRGVTVTMKMQYAELTALRSEDSRVEAVYRECEDAVLHRLDLAMAAFFRRLRAGEAPGFPRFKPRSRWHQLQFPHGNRALKFTEERVYVPGAGTVRLRKGRSVPEKFGRGWLRERNDRWYLCVEHEIEAPQRRVIQKVLGIDRGVRVLAATSEGELIGNLAVGERRKRATGRLQRELDTRTQKDAKGRCLNRHDPLRVAAVKRLARSREREANARRDYLHKVSRRLVDSADCIALKSLTLKNMTRSAKGTIEKPGRNVRAKAGLNRVILDSGFGSCNR
jgi:putative transposase